MILKTRSFRSSLLAALLCGVSATSLLAQGPDGPPPGGGGHHHGPPPNVLFDALDTNHDGVLSSDEIANAAASIKALLKNGATELKREDLRPPRPASTQNGDQAAAAGADKPAPAMEGTDAKPGPQFGGEGRPHHGPPPSPLFDAIDTNHDNVISAAEMDNAAAAIKSLLKNGATQLKREDLRPPRPPQPQEH